MFVFSVSEDIYLNIQYNYLFIAHFLITLLRLADAFYASFSLDNKHTYSTIL